MTPVNGAQIAQGDTVTVRALVSDENPASSKLSLTSSLDGALQAPPATSDGTVALILNNLSAGHQTLTLRATDPDGLSGEAQVSIEIDGALPAPEITISPAAPVTTDNLTATLVNPAPFAGMTLAYVWQKQGGSTTHPGAVLPAADTREGDVWQCVLTITDSLGQSARATAETTILDSPPTLASASIAPQNPTREDTATCSVSGYADVDGNPATIEFSWFLANNGTNTAITGNQPTRALSDLVPGDRIGCTATPFDGTLLGASVSSGTVTVQDVPPTVASVVIDAPSPPTVDATLTCVPAGVSDAAGDPVTLAAAWFVNGVLVAGATGSLSGAFVHGDVVTCQVTPADPFESGLPVVSASVTIADSLPTIGSVLVQGGSVCGLWVCEAQNVYDADGDAVTVSYSWWVSGVLQTTTSNQLPPNTVQKGNWVSCAATPNDGWTGPGGSQGAQVTSSNTVVATDPPPTATTSIPDHGRPGDDLLCTVTTTDDCTPQNELQVSYTWTVNGTIQAGQTASTFSTTGLSGGDEVECLATVSDGVNPPEVFPSSALGMSANSFQIQGTVAGASAGWSIAVIDDLNGDGFREIAVGAPNATWDSYTTLAGGVYVAYGRDDVQNFTLDNVQASDGGFLIQGVSGSYDLETDGCGPWYSTVSCPQVQSAGSLDGLSTGPNGSALGFALAYPGDVNNDGVGDLVASSPYDLVQNIYQGRSFVLSGAQLGASSLFGVAAGTTGYVFDGECGRRKNLDVSLDGAGVEDSTGPNGDLAGYQVAAIGDFNGDGLADIALAAPNNGWYDEGTVYVVYGQTAGKSLAAGMILQRGCETDTGPIPSAGDGTLGLAAYGKESPSAPLEHYGTLIAPAGDFNGDGYADLLIQDPELALTNRATVVLGGPSGTSLPIEGNDATRKINIYLGNFTITPTSRTGILGLGFPAGGGGDVNGDGIDDLVFQIQDYSTNGFLGIVYGRSSSNGNLDLDTELAAGSLTGYEVTGPALVTSNEGGTAAIIRDVNGDGYDDIAVGLPFFDAAGAGAVAVIFGGPTPPATPLDWSNLLQGQGGFVVLGENPGENLGWSVAGGDIDGDGLGDVIAGAPNAPGLNGAAGAGRVVVEYGRNFTGAITQYGGPSDETFTGTAGADSIVGGRGNDVIIGGGGADVLYGGAGNDRIEVDDDAFLRVEGGIGVDTLVLGSGVTTLNPASVGTRIKGFEILELNGQTITLSAVEINRFSDTSNRLIVQGSSGTVQAVGGDRWTSTGATTLGGQQFVTLSLGNTTLWVSKALTLLLAPTVDNTPISINEGQAVGTIVARLPATDPNGDTAGLTFALISDTSGAFSMDPHTGDLIVQNAAPLNYLAMTFPFYLDITVTDDKGLVTSVTWEVSLLLVPRPPDVLTPAPQWSVNEGIPTTIGQVISVELNPGDSDTWSLMDPSGFFQIDPMSGTVTLISGKVLDYAQQSQYIMTATATNTHGLSANAVVTLTVISASMLTEGAHVVFDIRDKSIWKNAPAEGQNYEIPGIDGQTPENCFDGTTPGQASVADNLAYDFLNLGAKLQVPFSMNYSESGSACLTGDLSYSNGSWNASLPADIQLGLPNQVIPGTTFTVSSSYTIDWANAAMWGASPGYSIMLGLAATNYAATLKACDTYNNQCGAVSVGPITTNLQKTYSEAAVGWVGQLDSGGATMSPPAPVTTGSNGFFWDWNAYWTYALTALGLPSNTGNLTFGLGTLAPGLDADAKVSYVLWDNVFVVQGQDAWNPVLHVVGLTATVTLEDGSVVTIPIGTPYQMTVPASADVNGDGQVSIQVVFSLSLEVNTTWKTTQTMGFEFWGGQLNVTVVNTGTNAVIGTPQQFGPYLPMDCGLEQAAAGAAAVDSYPCATINKSQTLTVDTTSTGDTTLLGGIVLQ